MKDCIRSDEEERVKDTSRVSDVSKKTHCASVTEVAEWGGGAFHRSSFIHLSLLISYQKIN